MAMGLSPCRRKVRSPGELARQQGPECSSRPSTMNSDGAGNRNLGHSINQALQLPGGKKVKAYVLMALHDDDHVSTHTTNHVQQCTDQLFTSDAEDLLRLAHRKSIMGAKLEQNGQDHDLLFPASFGGSSSQSNRRDYRLNSTIHANPKSNGKSTPNSPNKHSFVDQQRRKSDNTEMADETEVVDGPSDRSLADRPEVDLQSLLVSDGPRVEEFLARKLRGMQQVAVKRIAKAWIKGICPKKQAIFPYFKKKREREGLDPSTGDVPGWWPSLSVCRFVEPDHIMRDERIKLCLHLLRLRPDPAQLKEWNKGSVEPHQTHANNGWTAFLMELAPPSIFDDLREPDDKTEQRQKLLAQIYELAGREEDYERGDIDASDRYWYAVEKKDDKPHHKKKTRRSSELSNDGSDTESTADSARLMKKIKKASETTTPAKSPVVAHFRDAEVDYHMQDCKPFVSDSITNSIAPVDGNYTTSAVQNSWENYQFNSDSKNPNLLRSLQENNHVTSSAPNLPQPYTVQSPWVERSSPASFSTSAVSSGPRSVTDVFAIDRPDQQFPQTSLGHADAHGLPGCPPYVAGQFSQPQFDALQSSTPYAPVDLTNSPHSQPQAGVQQPFNPALYQIQASNAPSQVFAPDASMQARVTTEPSFRPCVPGQGNQAPFPVNPTDFYGHSEAAQMAFAYPEFRQGGEFQAPARVDRGFTGHASGVGGGAFT